LANPQGLGKGPIKKIKITHKLQASSRVGPPQNVQGYKDKIIVDKLAWLG
tara:strand:+ start:165 stop:314 length:150 start_codon:yes stop_codon:yes gene_type:complete